MEVHKTAELIFVKNRTLQVEGELEKIVNTINKKHKIDYDRPNDYGHRGFTLNITFDQFNIETFSTKNIEKIKELYTEYLQLRKKVKPLEQEYDIGIKVAQQLKEDMNKL